MSTIVHVGMNTGGGGLAPAAGYTDGDWRTYQVNADGNGVFGGLAVSDVGDSFSIEAGHACVNGVIFEETAAVTLSKQAVGAATGWAVFAFADVGNNAAGVAVRYSAVGDTTIPTLAQDAAGVWELPLAEGVQDSGGNSSLIDRRFWVGSANMAVRPLASFSGGFLPNAPLIFEGLPDCAIYQLTGSFDQWVGGSMFLRLGGDAGDNYSYGVLATSYSTGLVLHSLQVAQPQLLITATGLIVPVPNRQVTFDIKVYRPAFDFGPVAVQGVVTDFNMHRDLRGEWSGFTGDLSRIELDGGAGLNSIYRNIRLNLYGWRL